MVFSSFLIIFVIVTQLFPTSPMIKKIALTTALVAVFAFSSLSLSAQPPLVPRYVTFADQKVSIDTQDRIERMDRELLTFTYMHSTSTLMLKRAGKYFPIIEPILREQGIPDDLKYLMVIESNLDPAAVSSAGAAGLWQFMKSTAKDLGLEIRDGMVDERYNIEKETVAACKFLKRAYDKFGDWMTVAASYNCGQAGVSQRLSDQRQTTALELWLPEETARYMYRILAAKMMFEDPLSFGFNVTDYNRYPYIPPKEVVEVSESISSLVSFAEAHGTTYAKLKAANLWLRGTRLDNPSKKKYKIIIPGD